MTASAGTDLKGREGEGKACDTGNGMLSFGEGKGLARERSIKKKLGGS